MMSWSYCRLLYTRKMLKSLGNPLQFSQMLKTMTQSVHSYRACLVQCHNYSTRTSKTMVHLHASNLFETRQTLLVNVLQCQSASKHTSSLYVSDATVLSSAPIELDLGVEKRIARREQLKRNLNIRGLEFDIETFIEDYRLFKRIDNEKRRLETARERVAKKMAELKKQKSTNEEEKNSLVERGKQLREALKELQMSWWVWEERVMMSALQLPNDLRSQTPAEEEQIVDTFGDMPDKTKARCHLELVREKNLVKFSSAGIAAYYLKGELASLENDLTQSVTNHLTANSFHQLSCPEIFRSLVVEGCGYDYKEKDKVFTLQDKEQEHDNLRLDDFSHIAGVSPMSFAAYLAKTVVQTSDLPYRMFTNGRQYRPDGEREMPGLYGVCQSVKTAAMSVCADRVSCAREFNKMAALIWSMYRKFNLHLRLVLVPGCALLRSESMRVEIQAWAPSLNTFVKLGHIACLDDFVSRRLMCYHSNNLTDYKSYNHVHMVYSEVLDTTRLLTVMIECGVTEEVTQLLLEANALTAESSRFEHLFDVQLDAVS